MSICSSRLLCILIYASRSLPRYAEIDEDEEDATYHDIVECVNQPLHEVRTPEDKSWCSQLDCGYKSDRTLPEGATMHGCQACRFDLCQAC